MYWVFSFNFNETTEIITGHNTKLQGFVLLEKGSTSCRYGIKTKKKQNKKHCKSFPNKSDHTGKCYFLTIYFRTKSTKTALSIVAALLNLPKWQDKMRQEIYIIITKKKKQQPAHNLDHIKYYYLTKVK